MSGAANGYDIDLAAAVDREFVGDVGLPASAGLLAYTNAVCGGSGDIGEARSRMIGEIGDEATRLAAAVIAIFSGLVRVADGTGIQLDDGVFAASVHEREALGIDRFQGAANTRATQPPAGQPNAELSVGDLFG